MSKKNEPGKSKDNGPDANKTIDELLAHLAAAFDAGANDEAKQLGFWATDALQERLGFDSAHPPPVSDAEKSDRATPSLLAAVRAGFDGSANEGTKRLAFSAGQMLQNRLGFDPAHPPPLSDANKIIMNVKPPPRTPLG